MRSIAVAAMAVMGLAPMGLEAAPKGPTKIVDCQTIDVPGSYVVMSNLPGDAGLLAGGDCLVVGASGQVTIDLNGFVLQGVGTGTGISEGATGAIAVRNGTVRGFNDGISLNASSGPGNLIEGVRAVDNVNTGLRGGKGSIVSGNVLRGNGVGLGVNCPALISGNVSTGNGTGSSFDLQIIGGLSAECRFTDNVITTGPSGFNNH